jgi:alpha-L-fucosidase 2
MPPDSNTTHAPSYTSNLLWALHDCWRQWAYEPDSTALETLWPVLVGHMNLHLHLLSKESDGKLHLPPSWSPECLL